MALVVIVHVTTALESDVLRVLNQLGGIGGVSVTTLREVVLATDPPDGDKPPTPEPPPDPQPVKLFGQVTAPDGLNVRAGPAVTFGRVDGLRKGTKVEILEIQGGANESIWWRIGTDRWIAAQYDDATYAVRV